MERLDPREAAKRRREKIWIVAVAALFIATTYFEIRLSSLSNRLPFVNSIFFFGLINFNIILLMVLTFLVFRNVGKVFLERRRRVLGSRLKTKLVAAFLGFTIIPTIILFLISSFYINSSFDKWFSIKVQNTLQAALEITQTYYKNTSRVAQHLAVQSANDIRERFGPDLRMGPALSRFVERDRELSAVDGLEAYSDPLEERAVSSAANDSEEFIPRLPLDVLSKVFQGETVSIVQHIGRADLIRSAAPLVDPRRAGKVYGAVAVTFVIPASLVNRVDEISSVFKDYKDVNPLKYPVKTTYFMILIMMTALIIFASIWIGLYLARELTVPLERLVTATQKISEGDLDFQVLNPGSDEIAVLTSSFNEMLSDLKMHRFQLEATNSELTEKRAYVEAVLNNVTAGVLSVDGKMIIKTANKELGRLLQLDVASLTGKSLEQVFPDDEVPLKELFGKVQGGSGAKHGQIVQKQFALGEEGEDLRTLLATATPFQTGVIFVIDDTSVFFKMQREAAWREVARRIAHEIKNPLTPIKLSAQRLQKKFASHPSAEARLLRECTDTIIKNVDGLRDMVNEFSEFARFPAANPLPSNLNETLRETIKLYEEADRSISFMFQPEARMPLVDLDREQIKRMLINLLDNAMSVLASGVGRKCAPPKQVWVRTHYNEQLRIAVIDVEDNGAGMADNVRGRLFEPYFSTKAQGTGLGLAIVKRIVSDHHGFIRVQSQPDAGSKFTIELPVRFTAGAEVDTPLSRNEGTLWAE